MFIQLISFFQKAKKRDTVNIQVRKLVCSNPEAKPEPYEKIEKEFLLGSGKLILQAKLGKEVCIIYFIKAFFQNLLIFFQIRNNYYNLTVSPIVPRSFCIARITCRISCMGAMYKYNRVKLLFCWCCRSTSTVRPFLSLYMSTTHHQLRRLRKLNYLVYIVIILQLHCITVLIFI